MKLTVIGLGKLGLPLACLQAEHHRVFGIDLNRTAVDQINRGIPPIVEPGIGELLPQVLATGQFSAHDDFSVVTDTDMSLVIVPTPSKWELLGAFTSEYVCEAVAEIGKAIRSQERRHTVVICSTVMPGECDGPIRMALEAASGKTVGVDVGLVYSPEFIALGSVIKDMKHPACILIGASDPTSAHDYADVALDVVENITKSKDLDRVRIMSLTSAEIAKLALNSFVTMKISFANTLGEICERFHDTDATDVAGAIGLDPRVGSRYIRPGGPYGGPCFPRDNRAFSLVGEQVGVPTPLADATDRVNNRQIDRACDLIGVWQRPIVGIIGMSYKLGTPITEESYGVKLAKELLSRGYQVRVYDRQSIPNREMTAPGAAWYYEANQCFGDDTVTVLALPDDSVSAEFKTIFAAEHKRHSVLIDCWDCLPVGPWDETHIVRMGKSADAY